MKITFRGKEGEKSLKIHQISREAFSLTHLQLYPGTGELVESSISPDGLLSVLSIISKQSFPAW